MLLVLVLAGTFIYVRIAGDLLETIDNGLRTRADDLAALAGAGSGLGGERLVESDEGFSQILAPDGTVIATTLASGADPALDTAQLERAAVAPVIFESQVAGVEGEARILGRPADSPDGEVVVVAGTSLEDRKETLAGLVRTFLVGAPLALALASLIGYLLASRALGPVDAMRRRAAEITSERTGERLPLPPADDEVRHLGETLNSMLDRLEAGLERERVFVADASHELRTPLAILRTELELAANPERSAGELHDAVVSAGEEVNRLSRLADDLLVIARADQGRLPIVREPVELRELLERMRDRFAHRAAASGREIVVEASPGELADVDPLRTEQALGNLIDNALRHGSGDVRLAGRRDDGSVVLEVFDHGAGFGAGFEDEAFERFTRADSGRTGGGAGLGLAIVRVIADAHGGEATVASPAGGSPTIVRLTLPAVDQSSLGPSLASSSEPSPASSSAADPTESNEPSI